MSYDDWKTDPDYGRTHADLHRDELVAQITDERDTANLALVRAMQEIERLRDVLEEILDQCKDEYDVEDGDDGRPLPNRWMKLGTMIEEALGKGRW